MRIDKFIANNTDISRTEVRKLIKAGRIGLNDDVVDDSSLKLKGKNELVTVDGKPVESIGHIYYMLNKPEGYVSANSDASYPTVIDLLSNNAGSKGGRLLKNSTALKNLQVVGRLDLDTTGLILLTNDGDWNHRITSPKSACMKSYLATLDHPVPAEATEKFARGMLLEGEKKQTKPAFLERITGKRVRITIQEGKYHQVKRMFASVGCRVLKLHRESIGPIKLDSELAPGEFRELFPREVKGVENKPAELTEEFAS